MLHQKTSQPVFGKISTSSYFHLKAWTLIPIILFRQIFYHLLGHTQGSWNMPCLLLREVPEKKYHIFSYLASVHVKEEEIMWLTSK
jgi:hypothetical protein